MTPEERRLIQEEKRLWDEHQKAKDNLRDARARMNLTMAEWAEVYGKVRHLIKRTP